MVVAVRLVEILTVVTALAVCATGAAILYTVNRILGIMITFVEVIDP